MKLNSLAVLCLSLILFLSHFTLAKRGGSFGKSFSSKKPHRGSTHTNTNKNQGSSSHGGSPKQSGQPNQGGYPSHSGRPGYPGGYMNHSPKNRVLSPHFGSSYGYRIHGNSGGSPFSHSVQSMGMYPSDKSREFGRTAVTAAAGGAVAGMALGYGLGRFPRPHFKFHSPQEEYHYNHYMYRKYGVKSTDTNDYSRDYTYSQPPITYDSYMDSCMKRTDLLPAENRQPNKKPTATTTATTTTTTATVFPLIPDTGKGSNLTETNSTVEDNSSTSGLSTPRPLNQPKVSPGPSASQVPKKTTNDDNDDDTVSIVEIGYPTLIEQMNVRKCLELYMDLTDKYLQRVPGGVQGLKIGSQGLLAVLTSIILTLLNSNMLILLR